jgi:GNAT superfamily N-acetyltransferase
MVPFDRFPLLRPTHYGPRDVKVLRMAEKDIARLHPGQQARVREVIEDLRAGRAQVEPKERPPLIGSYTVRVTNSLRLGLYLTEDQPGGDPAPDWVVYWVGDHNYAEAERRMMHNAGAYGPFPEDVTFGPAPSYEGHPRIHPDWPGIRVKVRGEYAGHLYWDPETHTIADVYVVPHWQRRGIATELLRRAREIDPYLRHSYELTPDGRAWAEKVAGALPPGIEFEVHVATEDERYRQDLGGKVYARLPGRVTAEGDSPIVGRLVWRADGEIMSIYVAVDQQRQGIATEMLRRAREAVPYRIFHSDDLTPDGAAWAERVAKVAHTAALTVRTWDGRAGDPSHLTKEIRGTVPTSLIADLPGKRGEVPGAHRNKQGPEWEAFLEDIDSRGIQNAIFIVVEETGEAFIYEGNHRRDAAVELGLDEVPVEIRFFGKSEDIHPLGKIASQRVASDYWGGHRPTEEGPPVHDLLEGDSFAPLDIYENPHYYTGFARDPAGRESIEVIRSLRGQPGTVTIYRSAPPGVTSINTGDWVTLSRTYAEQHGYSNGDGPDWPVLSAQVPTEHVRWAGDDLVEWGYFGPPVNARTASLHTASSDYWGGHRPFEDGDPLHDLGSEGTFPQDVYDHPEWYSFDGYEREIGPILRAVRGKPDAMVTIYRALPPGAPRVINTGDWVTLSERYARQHAMKSDDPTEDWPVISAEVPASTVRSGGSDIIEWGYFGSPVNARTASLHTASSDIYAAEALLVPTLPRRSLRELKGLARRVLADEGYPAPHEVDIYADATVFGRASTQYTPEGAAAPEIVLGLDMMNDLTLLHELAHVIEGGYPYMPVPDDHGPRWRAIYARLLSRYLPEAHSALAGVLGHRTASSGLTFTHHPDTIFDGQGLADASWGVDTLAAYDGSRLVGVISWYASGGLTDGGVDALWVHEDYRRRGIATELLARAKAIYPAVNPLNTPWFTDDGKAFVNSLPGIHIAETGLIGGRQLGDIDLINNARWFHASTADLPPGAILTPGIERGQNNWPPHGDNTAVWITDNFDAAVFWARGNRWWIYAVEPLSEPVKGNPDLAEWKVDRARIIGLALSSGRQWSGHTASLHTASGLTLDSEWSPGEALKALNEVEWAKTASIGGYLKEWHIQETLRRQGHELMKPRTLATLQRKAEEVCAAGAAVLRPVVRLIPGPDSETHPPEPDGTIRIDISRENANLWSVLHECAHVLCYDRGMDDFDNFHGPGFREVFWGEVLAPYGISRDMTRTASGLTLEEYISVAEEAVERGHPEAGRKWHLPDKADYPKAYENPDYWEAMRPVTEYVKGVLASAGKQVHSSFRVIGDGWTVTSEGVQGATDGANWIDLRNPATTLTILHECAHVIRGTGEGAGHDKAFVDTLADLIARHISPAARDQFMALVGSHHSLAAAHVA